MVQESLNLDHMLDLVHSSLNRKWCWGQKAQRYSMLRYVNSACWNGMDTQGLSASSSELSSWQSTADRTDRKSQSHRKDLSKELHPSSLKHGYTQAKPALIVDLFITRDKWRVRRFMRAQWPARTPGTTVSSAIIPSTNSDIAILLKSRVIYRQLFTHRAHRSETSTI